MIKNCLKVNEVVKIVKNLSDKIETRNVKILGLDAF